MVSSLLLRFHPMGCSSFVSSMKKLSVWGFRPCDQSSAPNQPTNHTNITRPSSWLSKLSLVSLFAHRRLQTRKPGWIRELHIQTCKGYSTSTTQRVVYGFPPSTHEGATQKSCKSSSEKDVTRHFKCCHRLWRLGTFTRSMNLRSTMIKF